MNTSVTTCSSEQAYFLKNSRVDFLKNAIVCFLLFFLLSFIFKFMGSHYPINLNTYSYLQLLNTPLLNKLSFAICFFGDKLNIYPVIFLFSAWLISKQQYRLAMLWLALLFLSCLLIYLSKAWVASPRPGSMGGIMENYSFPSGHTAISTMWCGFLYLTAGPTLATSQRRLLAFVCVLIPILVMLARIYIGAHWATDVFAGFLLGYACYNLASYFYTAHPGVPVKNQFCVALIIFIIIAPIYAFVNHAKLAREFRFDSEKSMSIKLV